MCTKRRPLFKKYTCFEIIAYLLDTKYIKINKAYGNDFYTFTCVTHV